MHKIPDSESERRTEKRLLMSLSFVFFVSRILIIEFTCSVCWLHSDPASGTNSHADDDSENILSHERFLQRKTIIIIIMIIVIRTERGVNLFLVNDGNSCSNSSYHHRHHQWVLIIIRSLNQSGSSEHLSSDDALDERIWTFDWNSVD